MAEKLYRTQLLLEPEQHQALARMSEQERRSISEIVRGMIQQQLDERKRASEAGTKRRIEALVKIREHREDMTTRRGGKALEIDVTGMVRHMQEEQDERNLDWLIGASD